MGPFADTVLLHDALRAAELMVTNARKLRAKIDVTVYDPLELLKPGNRSRWTGLISSR